jgi:hypothetical protein
MAIEYVTSLDAGPFACVKTEDGFILAVASAGQLDSSNPTVPGISGALPKISVTPMIFAINQSLTPAKNFYGQFIYKFVFPATWTAAAMTFLECESENGVYTSVYDKTAEYSLITAAANRSVRVLPPEYFGVNWLKLRSGTVALAVNQAQSTTVLVYSYTF